MKKNTSLFSPIACILKNLLLLIVLYAVCRLAFYLGNRALFPGLGTGQLLRIFRGGLRFDLSALMYTNALWMLMMLLPFRFRTAPVYARVAKVLFVASNFIWFAADLADSVYFPYTNRRTTCTVFREFAGDDNIAGILAHEALTHWYLILLGAAILWVLIRCYSAPKRSGERYSWKDYLIHTGIMLACIYPIVGGMRGGFGVTVRPISLNDANLYIDKPTEAGLVLDTAFSMYRTLGAKPFQEPHWFEPEALQQTWSPVIPPSDTTRTLQCKNVVILILESFSASYSAYLTELHGEKKHEGYMPFLDSLMHESLIFRHSLANGRHSIDALPSVMCGIPSLIEPFFLTPYAQNTVHGLAEELGRKGWSSAFWHGAQRQSLGLAGFAHNSGFQKEYSRESYGDERDFDGTWGIWDEPFLQYFKRGMDALPEPFIASVFTLSSHNPFAIPARYEDRFLPGTMPIHRCVRYSDHALREFFRAASTAPWFKNTLFVLTGDHTSKTDLPEYQTEHGRFEIPIIFYTPDGSLKGLRDGIAQQTDIKPTVLSYLGYDEPCLSFGCDLLRTPDEETWALNYMAGTFQYFRGDYLLLFDGTRTKGLYDFRHDRLLTRNLAGQDPELDRDMETRAKAVIQQFISRMIHDRMTAASK